MYTIIAIQLFNNLSEKQYTMHQKKKLSTTSTANAITGNEGTIPKKQRCGSNETDKNSSTVVQQLTVRIDLSETLTNTNSGVKTTPTGSAMDNHPYARGSFIEVLHGVKEKIIDNEGNNSDNIGGEEEGEEKKDCDDGFDEWWDKDSDDENENKNMSTDDYKNKYENRKAESKEAIISVRLCDVIDRVAVESNKWRYYVHYRDFNRRMDEWISMDRIVSPPSVGNVKARAIKREEEKKKRLLQREKEREGKRKAALVARSVDMSAPRARRRRSTGVTGSATAWTVNNSSSQNCINSSNIKNMEDSTAVDGVITLLDGAIEEGTRRTRLRRKNATDADDATVVAGNKSIPPVMAAEKGTVTLPTIATSNTKVGEHVVQTIAAQELDEHEGLDEASIREHEEVTKVKNVAFLELGAHQMSTWYFSPLPKDLLSERGFIEVLYVCEFTLRMFSRKSEIRRFQSRLSANQRHPPGNEIYRKGNLSMFEVDGFEERIYCQNLCYIAKLFLDHKTLYFDVDPFLFYVLCEVDERGFHPVGYYSKEKHSDVGYNLACILTFPSHQRKGYGRFLIAFSYELSKKEEKVGSPEKPMSDLGQQAYKPYWASTIVDFLLNQCLNASMSIMDISKMTSIMAEDIVFTLNQLSILKVINGVYFIAAEEGLLKTLAKKYPVKEPKVDASKLHWTPFVIDVKRDKFSIHSKKPSVEGEETRGVGGF